MGIRILNRFIAIDANDSVCMCVCNVHAKILLTMKADLASLCTSPKRFI